MKRVLVVIITSLAYMMVSFQRQCPTIVAEDMAEAYNCNKTDISTFSSIFFYTYAATQPFAGLLSDIMEPAYIIGGSQIIAAVGALICSFGHDLTVGTIGRLLVGFGCGPTYVSCCRIMANWFDLAHYSFMTGILMIVGMGGGLLSQAPLALLCSIIGWKNAFYLFAGLTLAVALICIIFVRGDPVRAGFEPVNIELTESAAPATLKEKISQLFTNLGMVLKKFVFWVVAAYGIFTNGPYHSVSGMWGAPYLMEVFQMTRQKAGNVLMVMSAGVIVGCLLFPVISKWMNSRRWTLLLISTLSVIGCVAIFVWGSQLPQWALLMVLFDFGLTTMSISPVAYTLAREHFHPALAGSCVGCLNFFVMMSGGVYQNLYSFIIKIWPVNENNVYPEEAYKMAIWLPSLISVALSALMCFIMKDVNHLKIKNEAENYIDITEPESFAAGEPSIVSVPV